MARFSKSSQGMKLEDGDVVSFYGMKGKVSQVMVIKSKIQTDVLVTVDFTRGQGMPNVLNLCQIEAVRHNGEWVNLKGEKVAA